MFLAQSVVHMVPGPSSVVECSIFLPCVTTDQNMLPVSAGHNKPPLFVQHTDSSFIPYSGPPVPYIGQDKRPSILIPTPLTFGLFTIFFFCFFVCFCFLSVRHCQVSSSQSLFLIEYFVRK